MFKKSFYLVGLLLFINVRASQHGENKENISTSDVVGRPTRILISIQQIQRLSAYLRSLSLAERQVLWTNALQSLHQLNVYQNSDRRRQRNQ